MVGMVRNLLTVVLEENRNDCKHVVLDKKIVICDSSRDSACDFIYSLYYYYLCAISSPNPPPRGVLRRR